MFLKVLACEVALREIGFTAAQCVNLVDLEFLPVGHHNEPKKGHADLQARINQTPAGKYDAILVGYGICNLMLNGLTASSTPLVIPRAHDCITILLGSKKRYQEVFNQSPGTYYFTAGWLEFHERRARARGGEPAADEVGFQTSPFSLDKSFAEMVAKYGEENARYLVEVTQNWTQSYRRALLIRFEFDHALGLKKKVDDIGGKHGWQVDEMAGDLGLLQRWLNGQWDAEDFLVVPPGEAVYPSNDERVIEARIPCA